MEQEFNKKFRYIEISNEDKYKITGIREYSVGYKTNKNSDEYVALGTLEFRDAFAQKVFEKSLKNLGEMNNYKKHLASNYAGFYLTLQQDNDPKVTKMFLVTSLRDYVQNFKRNISYSFDSSVKIKLIDKVDENTKDWIEDEIKEDFFYCVLEKEVLDFRKEVGSFYEKTVNSMQLDEVLEALSNKQITQDKQQYSMDQFIEEWIKKNQNKSNSYLNDKAKDLNETNEYDKVM